MHKPLIAVVFAFAVQTGCSTYIEKAVYAEEKSGIDHLSFGDFSANLQLTFKPDLKWSSAGLLGAPIVPMYASSDESATLTLELQLLMRGNTTFSFALLPCLESRDGTLCPRRMRISPLFDSAEVDARDENGNRTFGRIRNFSYHGMEVVLKGSEATDRITSEQIYEYFQYTGDPVWIFGLVRVSYQFDCAGTCPVEFLLKTDRISEAATAVRPEGTFRFRKAGTREYRGLTAVQ
jgi:hypothetical protein